MIAPLPVRCGKRELDAANRHGRRQAIAFERLALELSGIDIPAERDRLEARLFGRRVMHGQRREVHVVVETEANEAGRIEGIFIRLESNAKGNGDEFLRFANRISIQKGQLWEHCY